MRHPRPTSYVQVALSDSKKRTSTARFLAAVLGFSVAVGLPPVASAQTANGGVTAGQNPNGGVTSKIVDTADLTKAMNSGGVVPSGATSAVADVAARASVATETTTGVTAATTAPPALGADLARILPTSTVVRTTKTTKKASTKKATKTAMAVTSTIVISPIMASTAQPTKAPTAKVEAAESADAMESALAGLRKCESGNRYNLNTGNGYYGAYQFSPRTWKGLGLSGLPHEASPAEQDAAARKLQAKAGWGQWPACSRKLGLR